jgi:hypothetical protein
MEGMVLPREAILLGTSTAKLIVSIPNNLISHIIMYPIHSTYVSSKGKRVVGHQGKTNPQGISFLYFSLVLIGLMSFLGGHAVAEKSLYNRIGGYDVIAKFSA